MGNCKGCDNRTDTEVEVLPTPDMTGDQRQGDGRDTLQTGYGLQIMSICTNSKPNREIEQLSQSITKLKDLKRLIQKLLNIFTHYKNWEDKCNFINLNYEYLMDTYATSSVGSATDGPRAISACAKEIIRYAYVKIRHPQKKDSEKIPEMRASTLEIKRVMKKTSEQVGCLLVAQSELEFIVNKI